MELICPRCGRSFFSAVQFSTHECDDICEIEGCDSLAMGCTEDDGCPAEHLCVEHYFQLGMVRGTAEFIGGKSPIPTPNEATTAKLRAWWDQQQDPGPDVLYKGHTFEPS